MKNLTTGMMLAGALLLMAVDVAEAHGWAVPPPTGGGTPPLLVVGGGNPTSLPTTGLEGGGNPPPGSPFGENPGGRTFNERQRAGFGSGTTPGSASRANNQPSRPKRSRSPWADSIRAPWQPAFAPLSENRDGYDAELLPVEQGITKTQAEGGWKRVNELAMLLVWDPGSKTHRDAVAAMESDARFLGASHLFDCFRVDARSLKNPGKQPRLMVFNKSRELVGSLEGKKLRKGFKLLDEAAGGDLAQRALKIYENLNGMAYCSDYIKKLTKGVVCPDCGHERHDVIERIQKLEMTHKSLELGIPTL